MTSQKPLIYIFGIFLLIVVAGYFLLKETSGATDSVINGPSNGEIQKVVLSFKNYNYYPNTITVNANQPVQISLDSSVGGCFRSFTMRDFGINQYLKTPQDYVEFTPKTPGIYRFACSMGMGTGTLIVK
jgi:plastocyanin domain-containing protein